MQNQKSALGLDGNITAMIGYLVGIIALVLIFIEKDNRFVRFHAIQSVLWGVVCTIGFIAIMIVGMILAVIVAAISSTLATIVGLLAMLLYLGVLVALFGGIIYGAIKSYGGEMVKLPVVSGFAEKWA